MPDFRLRLITVDGTDPRTGRWRPGLVYAGAERAAKDPRTVAYLGETNPGASAISLPVLNAAGVLQVSPTDTLAGLTRADGTALSQPQRFYPSMRRTFARVVPNDDVQVDALVDDVLAHHVRRVTVLDDGRVYGDALAKRFALVAQARGLRSEIVDFPAATPGVAADAVNAARAFRAQGVLFAGTTADSPLALVARLRTLAPRMTLFGPTALARRGFYARLNGPQPVTYFTAPSPRLAGLYVDRFRASFRARFGRVAGRTAVYGYAATELVLATIRRAGPGAGERSAVVTALHHLAPHAGVLGRYAIDPAVTRADLATRPTGPSGADWFSIADCSPTDRRRPR